jgi:hypothetical protein
MKVMKMKRWDERKMEETVMKWKVNKIGKDETEEDIGRKCKKGVLIGKKSKKGERVRKKGKKS